MRVVLGVVGRVGVIPVDELRAPVFRVLSFRRPARRVRDFASLASAIVFRRALKRAYTTKRIENVSRAGSAPPEVPSLGRAVLDRRDIRSQGVAHGRIPGGARRGRRDVRRAELAPRPGRCGSNDRDGIGRPSFTHPSYRRKS